MGRLCLSGKEDAKHRIHRQGGLTRFFNVRRLFIDGKNMLDEAKQNVDDSAYIVLFFLDGKLRRFFLSGKEIDDDSDFVERNRKCSDEDVIVLHNTAQNQKRFSKLTKSMQLQSGKKRPPRTISLKKTLL